MMSHLILHPKSEANYLCLYCLMTETLTGPLLPVEPKLTYCKEAISCLQVCHLTEAIHQVGNAPPPMHPI